MKSSECLALILLLYLPVPVFAMPELQGYVETRDGEPIRNAGATLIRTFDDHHQARRLDDGLEAFERISTTSTEADGFYLLEAPNIDFYSVLIAAEGHRPIVFNPQLPVIDDLVLPPARPREIRTLNLLVVTDGGGPLQAQVELSSTSEDERGREAWQNLHAHARTDENGKVDLFYGRGENLNLSLFEAGHGRHHLELKPADLKEPVLEVEMPRGAIRRVKILGPDGRPAVGVAVSSGSNFLGFSDEQGKIEISIAEQGLQILALNEQGIVDHTFKHFYPNTNSNADSNSDSDRIVEWKVSLKPWQRISGTVIGRHTRAPLAGALIWFSGRIRSQAEAGRTGGYILDIEPTPQPRASIQAVAHEHIPMTTVSADFVAGQETTQNFKLQRSLSIEGVVFDSKTRPIGGAVVRIVGLRPEVSLTGYGWTRTSVDGSFKLGLPVVLLTKTGFVTARATAQGQSGISQGITLDGGRLRPSHLEFRLPPETDAVGRLVDPSGEPIAQAAVLLAEEPLRDASFSRVFWSGFEPISSQTDEDGTFQLASVSSGRFRLQFRAPSRPPQEALDIKIEATGQEIDLGEFVIKDGTSLRGRVVDPQGAPVNWVDVTASPRDQSDRSKDPLRPALSRTALTDADGIFTIDGLPEHVKSFNLHFKKKGWVAIRTAVSMPIAADWSFALAPSRKILGFVGDIDGQPVAHAGIIFRFRGESRHRIISTDETGIFTSDQLPTGPASIVVQARGYLPKDLGEVDLEEPIRVVLEKDPDFKR